MPGAPTGLTNARPRSSLTATNAWRAVRFTSKSVLPEEERIETAC
jgi:hypothetical protein